MGKIHTNLKYATQNPISRYLIDNFNSSISSFISGIDFTSILDVGCGEGIVLAYLQNDLNGKECFGVDIDPEHISSAKVNAPFVNYQAGDIYNLGYPDNHFDVVMCLEVLEHLEDPERAITELCRVSRKYVLVSTPREPIWRFLNMVRGKYIRHLGNTPGHVNHWSSKTLMKTLGQKMKVREHKTPLPWTIVLSTK